MLKGYEIFQKTGQRELKQGLASCADCHIDYYKKDIYILYTMYQKDYIFGKIYYRCLMKCK
jgi:hypothetical protein